MVRGGTAGVGLAELSWPQEPSVLQGRLSSDCGEAEPALPAGVLGGSNMEDKCELFYLSTMIQTAQSMLRIVRGVGKMSDKENCWFDVWKLPLEINVGPAGPFGWGSC